MTQQGWGQAIARDQFPAGRLHIDQEVMGDNFGEMEWYPGQIANKEVYVENFGDMTPIFTRIRLLEYMEVGIGAELHPNDPDFADREAEPFIDGADRLNTETWTTLIPNAQAGSSSAKFRDHWRLTQEGGSKWFMPTFNQDPVSREPDVKGDAWGLIPEMPEMPNSTRRGGLPSAVIDGQLLPDQPFAYSPDAGLSDYFELNTTHEATVKTFDWETELPMMNTTAETHTAQVTKSAEIMTMDEWIAGGQELGNVWVLDTDGWAYWANPLEPGEATGLLLNSMAYTSPVIGTMYYSVYVDAEMAAPSGWELAFADLSPEAVALMKALQQSMVVVEPVEPGEPVEPAIIPAVIEDQHIETQPDLIDDLT